MVEAPALPQPGDTIAGKYLIERVIGRGGMSIVFGAHHCVTRKRFAIKWQLPIQGGTLGATPSEEATARFIREAQVAGRFQHPNVAVVYDVGAIASTGAHYMVMDWLDGESLEELLERVPKLSLQDALRILLPCMRCVDEAHAKGIIHRDLKPGNIFLCRATKHEPETPKVLDFGIAKFTGVELGSVGHITQMGALLGTPYYLSPEQVTSRPIDKRIDVYAFGVILYQVLAGRVPFSAASLGELLLQISAGNYTALRAAAPDVPTSIEQVIARAMAHDPDERFQGLGELIDALTHAEPALLAAAYVSPRTELGSTPSQYVPTLPVAAASGGAVSARPSELPRLDTMRRRTGFSVRVFLYAVAALMVLGGGGYLAWRQYSSTAAVPRADLPEPTAVERATVVHSIVRGRDDAVTTEAGQHAGAVIAEPGAGETASPRASKVVQAGAQAQADASLVQPERAVRVEEGKASELPSRPRTSPTRRAAKPAAVQPQPTAAPAADVPDATTGTPPTSGPAKSPRNPLRMRLQ